jgi:hypothetical protein
VTTTDTIDKFKPPVCADSYHTDTCYPVHRRVLPGHLFSLLSKPRGVADLGAAILLARRGLTVDQPALPLMHQKVGDH